MCVVIAICLSLNHLSVLFSVYSLYSSGNIVSFTFLPHPPLLFSPCAGRLILAATGPLNRHYDDPRRFYEAAQQGTQLALAAGVTRVLVLAVRSGDASGPLYERAAPLCALGAVAAAYVPDDVRASREKDALPQLQVVGMCGADDATAAMTDALTEGLTFARDLGGMYGDSDLWKDLFHR